MSRKKAAGPGIAPLHVWESELFPPLGSLITLTQLAHSFAEALIHDRDDAEVLREKFTRATQALRVAGWSGWPPPLILEFAGITVGFEEYFREVALEIYDDDDLEHSLTSIIDSAREVSYSAREFVNEREKSKQTIANERKRVAAKAAPAKKRKADVIARHRVLRKDDPHRGLEPIKRQLAREFDCSVSMIEKYLAPPK